MRWRNAEQIAGIRHGRPPRGTSTGTASSRAVRVARHEAGSESAATQRNKVRPVVPPEHAGETPSLDFDGIRDLATLAYTQHAAT